MTMSFVLALIVLVQFLSLILAIYWFRGSAWRSIWLAAIIASIVLGALRRSVLLAIILGERVTPPPGTLQDLIVLAALTGLLFFGVVTLHIMFTSLERAAAALREREGLLRDLVEHLPGVVYRCLNDETWTMLYMSREVEALTGYPAEEFIQNHRWTYASLICEADHSALEIQEKKLSAGETFEVRYRLRHISGREIWVRDRGCGVYDNEGNLLYLTGFIADITGQVQTENMLRIQRDLAFALSHTTRLEDSLSLCMHAAMDIAGMDAGGIYLVEQASGSIRLACHAGLPEWFVQEGGYYPGNSPNAQLVQMGKPVYTSYGTATMQSDAVGIREGLKALGVIPVKQDDAVVACINVGSHTLTEVPEVVRPGLETLAGQVGQIILRDKERALRREREANLATLFTSIRDMIFVLDAGCMILRVNPAVSEILGYSEQEVLGRSIWDMQFIPDVALARAHTDEIISGGRSTCELRLTVKDGCELSVEIAIVAGYWDQRPAYFALARDITERVEAEQVRMSLERQIQVARRLESLGILAGGVAHDFRNLLTVIMGNAELAVEMMEPQHPAQQRLDLVLQTAQHASDLCRQMLTYSGRGPVSMEIFHPQALFEEVIPLLKNMVSPKTTLALDIADALPPIEGDVSQLRQIILNLLVNAADAIGDQPGEVKVSLAQVTCTKEDWLQATLRPECDLDEYVLLSVSDSGCGMDEDTQKRLFDPFFTTKIAGRGLGMAAVMGIVRAHRGGIIVDSEPGKGSCFRIFLPISSEAPAQVLAETCEPYAPVGSAGDILLFVDDEVDLHDVARAAGRREGFEVLTAANGMEAVECYLQHGDTIRLVVLDMTMPVMDGRQTFQELRRLDPNVRVIVASGYSTSDFEQEFAGSQLVGVLHKPYSIANLQAFIQKYRSAIRRT